MPDLSILCINPDDDFELIHRAIGLIESAVNCKVIALSIFPFYSNDDLAQKNIFMTYELFLSKYKPFFEKEIGLRVFYPNIDSEIQELCDILIAQLREN